jgi:hypothetical protein
MDETATRSDSFILRIWREEGSPQWKGWVQHARSGEVGFVQSLADLLAFIERRTGELAGSPREGLR